MRAVPMLIASLAFAGACSKEEAKAPPADKARKPAVPEEQPVDPSKASDPATLPAAGTAPPATAVGPEFAPVWETPLATLQGQPTTLAAFHGKALLVVNVASRCGLTPQYGKLEALQKKYEAKGFTVVGFPCNQFGGQEPGSNQEIEEFCSTTYGVTFPMMDKVEVNGTGRHPVYQQLTAIADASGHTGDIRWNFEKFVISADGKSVTRFSPKVTPDDPALIAAVENGLP